MTGAYRAQRCLFTNQWTVQTELPCINGLSAWFTVASIDEADEAEMGYTDGLIGLAEERAQRIAEALNAMSDPAPPTPTTKEETDK